MQFSGKQLEEILRKQTTPVEVVDYSGRVRLSTSGVEVATGLILTGYVGVGNNSRIRYVKPEGVRYRPERFGCERQIKADLRESAQLSRDVELNRVLKGAKTWPQQPARAKTDRGGSLVTIFVNK